MKLRLNFRADVLTTLTCVEQFGTTVLLGAGYQPYQHFPISDCTHFDPVHSPPEKYRLVPMGGLNEARLGGIGTPSGLPQ